MNKLLFRGILLIIFAGVLILIIFRIRSPFGRNNSSFASVPREEITRIEFSQNGKKLTLENKGESWLVNGKSEARKTGVLFILRVLKEIKIKSPVSPDLFTSEITGKNIIPVKVRVFEKGRNLSTFLVYKTSSNIYGNIMKIKGTSKPFIVSVPGYEGDIGSGFTLNELFWQSYTVFNLLPSEVASVKFENFSDSSASFSIINRDHHSFLAGDSANISGWDPALVTRYISYFAWVPFESWDLESGESEQKAIEQRTPLYRISVSTSEGKTKVLTLWELVSDKTGKDSDRLYGKTNDTDKLFIMRYFDIDPLIKKKPYFFGQ
jgi:hypothetical protein